MSVELRCLADERRRDVPSFCQKSELPVCSFYELCEGAVFNSTAFELRMNRMTS